MTQALESVSRVASGDSEKTLAVTGFQVRPEENLEDRVKVSVGKQSRSSGFVSWNNGSVDGNLNQADNLRMAQEKIIELENENERLRRQNEELIAASEIIKERSDLLISQLTEFKNDQDGLEQSFKNEMTLLKNHLSRKDAELQRAQFKVDELESKLKFDMKKIRVRERELENRLELVRAEKNAISKNKDEQILDLRRKMDVLQMEVDSYRQKCVELNKQIENSQDSFKRTTRALRLAMANLELQEENKVHLKKAE
jgi:chromosome segregation ATPase